MTINDGVSVINYGTIAIEGNGEIVNNHKIDNYGTLPTTGIDRMPPTITTEALDDGEVGKAYSMQINTSGNITDWAFENRNLNMSWLSISEDGLFSGTPTSAGDYKFTLVAYNDAGSHRKHFTLHINEAPNYKITVDNSELDFGTLCPNYEIPEAKTVKIINDSNRNIEVSLPTSNNYTISAVDGFVDGKASLAPGDIVILSIVPNGNLPVGNYEEEINIKTNIENVSNSVSVKFKVEHKLTKVEAKSATCTTEGNIEYYKCDSCGKLFKDATGTTEIKLADTVVKASGHSYGEPSWSWTSDTQAVATFKCKNGDDSQQLSGIMSSKITKDATCDATGVRTYIAKVVFNGKDYSTTKDIEIAKLSCTTTSSPSPTPYDDGGPFTRNECGDVFDRWGNLIYDAPDCVVKPKPTTSAVVNSPKPTTSTLEPIETEEVEETSEPEETFTPSPTPSATVETTPEVEVEKESNFGFIWWIIGGIGVVIAGVVIYLIIRSRNEE